jgi:hypothetical protein
VLDTVIIDADVPEVELAWRASHRVHGRIHDVVRATVRSV